MSIRRGTPGRDSKWFPSLPTPKFRDTFIRWGGVGNDQSPTFDAESKSAKIQNSLYSWEGIGHDQFPTFDAESKSAKIQNSLYSLGGGGCDAQFVTFDAKSKSAKIQNSLYSARKGGGWEVGDNQFPNSSWSSNPNLNFLFRGGEGRLVTEALLLIF